MDPLLGGWPSRSIPCYDPRRQFHAGRQFHSRFSDRAIRFPVHRFLYETVFSGWDDQRGPWPAWSPSEESQRATNIWRLMESRGFRTYEDLRRWSCENREQFWELMVEQLGIRFSRRPSYMIDPSSDAACPRWLVDASFNIVDSCFDAPADATAIVYRTKSGATSTWSYGELLKWTNRVANGLVESGFEPGQAIGVCLPMTAESVAIYSGDHQGWMRGGVHCRQLRLRRNCSQAQTGTGEGGLHSGLRHPGPKTPAVV